MILGSISSRTVWPLMKRETEAIETLASRATSCIVALVFVLRDIALLLPTVNVYSKLVLGSAEVKEFGDLATLFL